MKAINTALRISLIAVASLATASCGFHFRQSYNLPQEIQSMSVTSFDPYGNLKREMIYQLKLHDIKIVPNDETSANLHLKGESYGESTLSLYQNSRVAEKQFNYSVSYSVTLAQQGSYNFSTSLSRTYLDNPLTALAKSIEEEMLAQEMRIEATKQIIRQLARLNVHVEKHKEKEAQEKALNDIYTGKPSTDNHISIETRFDGKETRALVPMSRAPESAEPESMLKPSDKKSNHL